MNLLRGCRYGNLQVEESGLLQPIPARWSATDAAILHHGPGRWIRKEGKQVASIELIAINLEGRELTRHVAVVDVGSSNGKRSFPREQSIVNEVTVLNAVESGCCNIMPRLFLPDEEALAVPPHAEESVHGRWIDDFFTSDLTDQVAKVCVWLSC